MPKSKDEAKFQDSDVPIGIWSWAKSNQEYKQLISNLGINEIDNDQILMNLVEGNSNYQTLETTNYRNDPNQRTQFYSKNLELLRCISLKRSEDRQLNLLQPNMELTGIPFWDELEKYETKEKEN